MTMSRTGRAAAAILCAVLAGGCASRPGGSPPATPVATAATPAPTTAATGTPSASPTGAEPTLEPPPVATLRAGSVEQPGEPGAWTWAGGSNSAPWLPATALERLEVRSDRLTVDLDAIEVESWTARAADAADTAGVDVTGLADGTGTPAFDAPPPGAWVVAVHVVFAGGLGDAVYYWHLEVR